MSEDRAGELALDRWEAERGAAAAFELLYNRTGSTQERVAELIASGEDPDQAWDQALRERHSGRSLELGDQLSRYVESMTPEDVQRALLAGISGSDIFVHGLVGVVTGRLTDGGRWEESADGERLFVTPVKVEHGRPVGEVRSVDAWMTARYGEAVDLVAWDPSRPQRYGLLTGVGVALGSLEERPRSGEVEAPRVYETILDWLRPGGSGLAVLTRDDDQRRQILALVEKAGESEKGPGYAEREVQRQKA